MQCLVMVFGRRGRLHFLVNSYSFFPGAPVFLVFYFERLALGFVHTYFLSSSVWVYYISNCLHVSIRDFPVFLGGAFSLFFPCL